MENLTQEELQSLQEVVAQYEEVSFRVGQFTIEIEGAKDERKKMVEMANQALDKRMEILKELEEKYGANSRFNVATGEITKA
jgi:hypothetical protein